MVYQETVLERLSVSFEVSLRLQTAQLLFDELRKHLKHQVLRQSGKAITLPFPPLDHLFIHCLPINPIVTTVGTPHLYSGFIQYRVVLLLDFLRGV
jgi:hypothetical protein